MASQIPQAVLAGILVKVGWDILDLTFMRQALKGARSDLGLALLVLGLTVFVDLITAVAVGVVLGSLAFVNQLSDRQLDSFDATDDPRNDHEHELLQKADGRVSVFAFDGPLSFGAAADLSHRAALEVGDSAECVVIDFERLPYLDASGARALGSLAAFAKGAGLDLHAAGLNDKSAMALDAYEIDMGFVSEHADRHAALSAAVSGGLDQSDAP